MEDIFKEIKEGVEERHHHKEDEHSHEEEKVLNQHDFEKACASIILHLVKGYCIEEGHGHNETKSNLPSKEFFINELFNGKKYLSEEDLESIAESLGIGKKSSESTALSSSDSHDGHNHRCRRSAASVVSSQEESHNLHRRAVDSHTHSSGGSGSVGATQTSSLLLTLILAFFPGGGGTPHMKGVGMLVVSLKGVTSDFGLT